MQDREVSLQNRLLAIEEKHVEEMKTMEVNHFDKMCNMRVEYTSNKESSTGNSKHGT